METTFPYNDVVLIEAPDPENPGMYLSGSGVAIGPHTILTASHVLFDISEQTQFQSLYIYPGWNGPDPVMAPSGVSVTDEHYNQVGLLGSDSIPMLLEKWDYAIIETNYTFSSWLNVSPDFPGGVVSATGYPGTGSGYPGAVHGYQETTTGAVTADPTYSTLDHLSPGTLQTYSGMSGGPLMDNLGQVVGVVSQGNSSGEGTATQITSTAWTEIKDWVYLDGYSLGSDTLFQSSDGQVIANLDDGNEALVGPNPGSSWKAVGTGDFNGDGRFDLLLQNADGQLAVWDLSGTNLIGGGMVGLDPGPSWHTVGTGDFNGDKLSDVLFQNSDGQAAVWEMNGNNVIGGGAVGPNPGPSWEAVGTGDFNGDGRSDILWQNAAGQVAIWEMNGSSLIGGGILSLDPGPSWKAIGTGDFNHDGHSDVLLQNPASGQIAIWEMNGTNPIGGGTVSASPGPSWHAIGTGGEGSSDILLQNTSGQAATWDMNGTKIIGGGVVSINPVFAARAVDMT